MLTTIFTKLSFIAYSIAILLVVVWGVSFILAIAKKVDFSLSYKVLYWIVGFATLSTFLFSIISH